MKSVIVRLRAFRIWQKLGYNPWEKPKENRKKATKDFYKGAFDSIPFLNDDARRTFTHLLLRPGYMIRDYIKGDHERYLAPLTALIIFYAFFALVSSVMQPVQRDIRSPFDDKDISINFDDPSSSTDSLAFKIGEKDHKITAETGNYALKLVQRGWIYLNLDKYPEEVHTQAESSLAALEGTLRSQGIPLFIGQFFLLWLSMSWALRRREIGMSATAAASAYILCQFSFFMLFAVLLTFGKSKSVSSLLLLALLIVDLRQWLDLSWKKSVKLAIKTSILYGLIFLFFITFVSLMVMTVAWIRG